MSWLLRWNTAEEPTPWVVARSSPSAASVCEADSGNIVAFAGYLFDRADLRVAGSASDAALVASVYERWNDGLFDKLRGGFALAVWDAGRRQLTVARDALGLHPCFYRWDGGTLYVSPSLDVLLAESDVPVRFDRVVLAEYLFDAISTHQAPETFYEGIRRLPPARALTLRGGFLTTSRYWDPTPPGFAWASDEESARFASVLDRAVGRCLSAGADSVSLSGGFDSVSLAVLAAGQRAGQPPLRALSLRLAGTAADESPIQLAVAGALGMPMHMRNMEESLNGESAVGASMALARTSPSPIVSPWQSVYTGLFRSAAGLGIRRPLLGTGGDDVLVVDASYAADCLAGLDLRGLWRFARACQRISSRPAWEVARSVLWEDATVPELKRWARSGLRRVSPRALERVLERRRRGWLPAWLLPHDSRARARIDDRWLEPVGIPLARGERAYVGSLRRLMQRPLMLIGHDQSHAWAGHVGFTFFYPYFDRDVVELSVRTEPSRLLAGGRMKAPLRRLLAERLAGVVQQARKVDVSEAVHRLLRGGGRRVWLELGGPARLGELGIVDPDQLNRRMDDYFAGRHDGFRLTWNVLSTEIWLRARATHQSASIPRRHGDGNGDA